MWRSFALLAPRVADFSAVSLTKTPSDSSIVARVIEVGSRGKFFAAFFLSTRLDPALRGPKTSDVMKLISDFSRCTLVWRVGHDFCIIFLRRDLLLGNEIE